MRFWFLGMVVAATACGGAQSSGAHAPHVAKVGRPCQPPGVFYRKGKPVDFEKESSVMKAEGKPVKVCVRLRHESSGRVIDDASGKPIPGAVVTVESWKLGGPIVREEPPRRLLDSFGVETDPGGNWRVSTKSEWMRGILAADGLPMLMQGWCVRAPGYEAIVHVPWADASGENGLSEVRLSAGEGGSSAVRGPSRSACGVPLEPAL